jgi:hypothetical protein
MPFLTDKILLADDLIYIPKWQIQGFYIAEQGILVFAKFLSIISGLSHEPGLLRMAFIFIFSLAFGIFSFAMLYEFSTLTVALFALLSALIQMGVDQAIFIVGSYPMLGVALVLTAFSFIYLSSRCKGKLLTLMIPGYIFVTLAQLVHPVFSLVPLAFLVLTPLFEKKYAIINMVCISISYGLRIVLTSTYTYHYSQLKGWVDYSIGSIFNEISRSVTYVWSTINIDGKILISLLFCSGFVFFLSMLKKKKYERINKNKALIALFFIVVSALTYGPTVVINGLKTRYFYAPQLFCLLSFMIFTTAMARSRYKRLFVNTLLAFLCISFWVNILEFHKNRFTGIQHTQRVIKNCLDNHYLPAASANDQTIIFLNRIPSYFTGAYNHWSTWFLRYQTGNKNLIGLVGTKALCSADPIVNKYKDHNKEYWGVKIINGKELSYRIRMKGLETNRNTFAFEQTKDGFVPVPFLIIPASSGAFQVAKWGKPFKIITPDDPVLQEVMQVGFRWPGNTVNSVSSEVNVKNNVIKYDGSYLEMKGEQFLRENVIINNNPSQLVFEMILRTNDDVFSQSRKYSVSYPPMPLKAYPLAIYQANSNTFIFQIKHKNGDKYIEYIFDPAQWQKIVLSFDLKNNMMYLFINNSVYDVVQNIDINVAKIRSVTLGKGYLRRFWKGDIAYLKIYEPSNLGNRYYLNKLK